MKHPPLENSTHTAQSLRDEQLLRESGERFRRMADAMPQIVWITDGEGRVQYFNQQWRNYTGLSYNHATAAEVAAATVHPDDADATMEAFALARARGETFEVEHRIRAASGVYRWFLVRAEPYRDAGSGEISEWFGCSVDIHDRRQAEEDLHFLAARQSFQLALADRIRPLTDPDEIIAAASELLGTYLQAERVFYGEVDETGQFLDLQRDWTAGTLPSMAGIRLTLNDFGPMIIDDAKAGRVLAVSDVTKNAKSAGNADAYLTQGIRSFIAIPLMKDGRLRASLNIHRADVHQWSDLERAIADDMVDRTWAAVERARAQIKLWTERDRSRSVFSGMTEGFALFAPDWTVLAVNDEALRLAQRPGQDVVGKNHWMVWPESLGTEAELRYRRVMASKVPETWEYLQHFANGYSAWIEARAYPAGKDDLAVFFRDITERKIADQKLKDADRRKDEFLAMLAHELRNPLAPIGAAAQLLHLGRLDEDRVRQTSQIISRQVQHMTHLIDDLLDVSRVTRGLVELETAPLDIRRIVVDAVEQVTPLIQARRHHLAMHLPPDTTVVMGDKKRLVQVLANVLNNAAKYTPEGGNIALRTEVRHDHVLIEVSDDGIGMAADLVAHAFELFAQAERSSDRSAGGLGLGLALVKNLVELHGGTVTCKSPGIGAGSAFTVCLPRLEAARDSDAGRQAEGAYPAAAALRVMIVDDNVDAAQMLAMLLESLGHTVTAVHEPRLALELAPETAPDVYLLDIGLPEMDGNELAMRLRQLPAGRRAVLVAITGYGQEVDRKRTLAAGFDHHLVKPVDMKQLADILAQVKGA